MKFARMHRSPNTRPALLLTSTSSAASFKHNLATCIAHLLFFFFLYHSAFLIGFANTERKRVSLKVCESLFVCFSTTLMLFPQHIPAGCLETGIWARPLGSFPHSPLVCVCVCVLKGYFSPMPFDSFSVWSGSLQRQYGWAEEEEETENGAQKKERWRVDRKSWKWKSRRTAGWKKERWLKEWKKGRGETRREVSLSERWRKEGKHQGLETDGQTFSPFFVHKNKILLQQEEEVSKPARVWGRIGDKYSTSVSKGYKSKMNCDILQNYIQMWV